MSSYPYHRKSALEECDPQTYALFCAAWKELCDLQQKGLEKPDKNFAKKCRTILSNAFPWLESDQLKWLTDLFGMFVPPEMQAFFSLYRTLLEHGTLSQPPPTHEEWCEVLNQPSKWPLGVNPGKLSDGYDGDIDGPKPLRDLSDLQCYLVERRDTLMSEVIDVPGAVQAIEDAKSWLEFWDHDYPVDSSWSAPTTRSEARDVLNRMRQYVEKLMTPRSGADKTSGQTDKGEKSEKQSSPRKLDKHAKACIKIFRDNVKNDDRESMKRVVSDYVIDNPDVSESGTYRRLTDNNEKW